MGHVLGGIARGLAGGVGVFRGNAYTSRSAHVWEELSATMLVRAKPRANKRTSFCRRNRIHARPSLCNNQVYVGRRTIAASAR